MSMPKVASPPHVFGKWSYVDPSDLGMGDRLHVGDTTWNAGLLLEL
jgi:hypothetical protein